MNEYKYFSAYYDSYMLQANYDKWFRYLSEISGIENWKEKDVLDLGCGTGILAEKFAAAGASVCGVDISEDMLSLCDRRLFEKKLHCNLIKSDISSFTISKKFDFIYSACDVMNYLDYEKLSCTVTNASDMLKDGAVFTFDFIPNNRNGRTEKEVFTIGSTRITVKRFFGENVLETELVFKSGSSENREVHKQSTYSANDILRASEHSQMEAKHMYEALLFESFTSDSDKIQAVFSKSKKI